jgi:hypothetical protein
MTEYYVLLFDVNRGDLEDVADHDMGSFDLMRFWTGDYFEGPIPTEVKIDLDEGLPNDMPGNPLGWLLISERLQKMMLPLCRDHVQFLPITCRKKGKAVNRYRLANPLGSVDAIIAKKKKADLVLERMVLATTTIPSDRHLFRLTHQETVYVISGTLFDQLHGKGLNGVAAFKLAVR